MKKTTLTIVLSTLLAVFVFTGCHSTKEEKIEDAKENIDEAKDDIKDANSMDDNATSSTFNADEWKAYRTDVEARIDANNTRIKELRAKISKPGVALDKMRAKRIDEIQERNAKLKADLDAYEANHSDWAVFKANVDKEMDDLSKSLDEMSK